MVATSAGFFGFEGKVPLRQLRVTSSRPPSAECSSTTSFRMAFRSRCATGTSARRPSVSSSTGPTATAGAKRTVLFADALMQLGFGAATKAGVSICIDDMQIPSSKSDILGAAQDEVDRDRGPVQRRAHHHR